MTKKLLITAALALIAALAFTGTAGAYDATISPGGEIAAPSAGKVTFTVSGLPLMCNITLNGSLATSVSSIESVSGQSLGTVSSVNISNCDGGVPSGVLGTPWNIGYAGYVGTLPNEVTSVRFIVEGAAVNFSPLFGELVNCLYESDVLTSMAVSTTRRAGVYTSGSVEIRGSGFSFVRGSGLCPSSGAMTGTFTMSPTQTITVS